MTWLQTLKDYQHYLKIERGLSLNSIKSYSYDVEKLMKFLEKNDLKTSPLKIDANITKAFVYDVAKHMNERSQARLISGLKSFFNYLVFEDYRETNPVDLIESPRIGRKLPDTLSLEEIDNLIAHIDLL